MTQTSLLETSVDFFGRLGFDGASTRDIARASNTSMSSIIYLFGGKEGLYLATADYIAEHVRERTAPMLDRIDAAGIDGSEAAIEQVLAVLDGMAEMMLGAETESWARYIIREQQAPTEAFGRFYEGAIRRIADTLNRLVAIARPDLDDRQGRVTAVVLFGQAMILRSGRTAVCRVLGVSDFDEADRALLRERLRANALAILSDVVR